MKRCLKLSTLLLIALSIFVHRAIGQGPNDTVVLNTDTVLNPSDPIVIYNSTTPPAEPPFGYIKKWVKTNRLNWNTSSWKAYIYKGVVFRIKFPKTYNPSANDGKRYPMLAFFHGLGESASIYDNEFQLYHGGEYFSYSVDNGTFDGYVIALQSQGFWGTGHYQYLREIIDYMAVKNKLDPFQISVNGLSAGGAASWEMAFNHPSYVSSSLPMSSVSYLYSDAEWLTRLKFTPIWLFQGGLDGSPTSFTARGVRDGFWDPGDVDPNNPPVRRYANFKYTEYPQLGHATWDHVWNEPDFWGYQKRAYAANPWPLEGRTEFCPTNDPINVTLGVAPGFHSYEWRRNNVVVQTGSVNTLQITQLGTYSVRLLKRGIWSELSRKPIVIKLKGTTVTPNIAITGMASKVLPGLDGSANVQLELPAGYASYEWQRVGSNAVLGTSRYLTVSTPGDYIAKVTEPFGCASDFSLPFKVVDANGPNKPDPAVNLIATTLSKTSIRLNWSDNPSPQFNETNFEIYQGTQMGGPYKFAGITNRDVKSFIVGGLTSNTKYFFKVRAVNNSGAANASNEATGTTLLDVQAPTAPGNLTITSSTRSTISLNWSPSTDDVGVVRYDIYVNGVKTFATVNTNFTLSGLQYPNQYTITVRAADLAGNLSPHSGQVNGQALLQGLDYRYYYLPEGTAVLPNFSVLTPVSTGKVNNITLDPRTRDNNICFLWEGYIKIPVSGSYRFRTNSDDGSRLYLGELNGIGSPYTFTVSPTLKVDNDGGHAPTDVTSMPMTLQAGIYPIAITWFQGGGGFTMNALWNTPETGANTFTLIPDSAFSDQPVVSGSKPANPSNLVATPASYKQINLSWTDNSNNESFFEVWRSTHPFADFTAIGLANSFSGTGTATYQDTTLRAGTRYYYKVRAVNQFGESAFDKDGQGVDYSYYEINGLGALPDFNSHTPKKTGHQSNFTLGMQERSDNFQVRYSGSLYLPTAAMYTFYINSDDGSQLFIDGNLVVNNDGGHGPLERSGSRNLTPGAHSIVVTYFEATVGELLQVKISAPGLPKQLIPNSYLGTAVTGATTMGTPAPPLTPSSLVATAQSKSAIMVNWADNATDERKYEVYRSGNNNSNYVLIASLSPDATSYRDTGLFANSIFYYKVRAVGITNSLFTNEDSSKTFNTAPVIVDVPSPRTVRFGISTALIISASDIDEDVLSFTSLNFPSFASLTNNGNKTATLNLNPTSAQQGVYNNLRVIVSDPNGGTDTSTFNLIVNDNYDPVITPISDYTVNENETLSIPFSASDLNGADVLTWSVSGVPNAFTLTPGANGSATLTIKPTYGASGSFASSVTVSDGAGGYASRKFNITVNDKNPNIKVFIRVRHDASNIIGLPWNTVTSATSTNFTDENGNATNIGLTFTGGFNTGNGGLTTGNNSGVYPDAVIRDYYVFGAPWMAQTADAVLTGLDPTRRYSLTLHGSSNWDIASNNGSTNYTVNGVTKSLSVQNNIHNTVTFDNIAPAGNGTVTINMSKGTGAAAGYLNSIVINSSFDDGSVPISPISLVAQNVVGQGVRLTWQNLAYNETGYEIYRSTNESTGFVLAGLANGADATTYLDGSVNGNTVYYYKIRSISLSGSYSAYTDVVSISTINRIPTINSINNIWIKNNQTLSVNVSATDDAGDQITLTAKNLPQFATFSDNGNGTGVITLQPLLSSVGVYKEVTISAKDNSGVSSSTSFNITVSDKDMQSLYLNFSDGSLAADKPWNNLTGWPAPSITYNNLKDDNDSLWSSVSVSAQGFAGVGAVGMRPGNGAEVYPASVIRTGLYDNTANSKTVVVSGLSTARRYNFVFFNSHDDGTNGNTNFTIDGETVRLQAMYNIDSTAQINGVQPNSSGQVTITVNRAAGNTEFAYLNAMIIQSYINSASTFNAPTNLRVINKTRNSITIDWEDRSDNETGFSIYRSTSGGSYQVIGNVGANVSLFTDQNLNPNQSYYYLVRATKASAPTTSGYSNIAEATTYAYAVYINFSNELQAGTPWNNTSTVPQLGYVWNNLRDENSAVTSLGLQVTSLWGGLYGGGVNTGNNSGIFPDNVMRENYGLFQGQVATIKITGLNLTMLYDFTFFGSAATSGDVNTAYMVNGKTVLLNTSQNKSGTVTIYGIVPNENGEVTITVSAGTLTSQFGLLAAAIIQGYNKGSGAIPTPPSQRSSSVVVTHNGETDIKEASKVIAYPNPFRSYFTLSVSAEKSDKLDVLLYDVNGRIVYQNRFANLAPGINVIKVQPDSALAPGIYFVKAIPGSNKDTKLIKVVKE